MAEYIERERVVDVLVDMETLALYEDAIPAIKNIRRLIDGIPADDVAPVRHGRWIWDKDGMDWNIGAWRCSECKAMSPMWWNTDRTSPKNKSGHHYCPNCGAKMDKEKE